MSQRHLAVPEDGLKPHWLKIGIPENHPHPRSVPMLSRGWPSDYLREKPESGNLRPLRPLTENPESGKSVVLCDPYRKWGIPKSGSPM